MSLGRGVRIGTLATMVLIAGCGSDTIVGGSTDDEVSGAREPTATPTDVPGRAVTEDVPEGPVHGRMGEPVVAGDMRVTVHGLRFDNCPDDPVYEALPGNTYALVDAEFELLRSQPGAGFLGPLMWELHDSSGEDYTSESSCHEEGDTSSLRPGNPVRRTIAFQVPGHASGLVFVYGANADSKRPIVIDLGE